MKKLLSFLGLSFLVKAKVTVHSTGSYHIPHGCGCVGGYKKEKSQEPGRSSIYIDKDGEGFDHGANKVVITPIIEERIVGKERFQ